MIEKLTLRQKEVLDFIRLFLQNEDRPPTLNELCRHFGWKSDNSARQNLRLLAQKGVILLDAGSSRGIRLAPELRPTQVTGVPLVGKVAAGRPIEAIENIESRIGLDPELFPEEDIFALTVQGESMSGIGIRDQDIALVHKQATAKKGDIVVAIVNDEATVKRYMPRKRSVVLRAENPEFDDIVVSAKDELTLVGVVIGILRRM